MSVKIRLSKTGKTHRLSWRIVAVESHSKRDGRFIEILGSYNPHAGAGEELKIKKDRIDWWISKGAQSTPAVVKLISKLKDSKSKP